MQRITVDGNEACSRTAYLFTEVAGIYPITPSSPMAEYIDNESNKGKLNLFNDRVKVVEMQSEAGAAGFIHGSLTSGLLTTTFTSSQGLLLMIPNMYKIAGELLPGVFHVAARSLATHALSIMGDHQDIYATRQTGVAMLASSSVQDAALLSAVAHLSAIESSVPFMHFFDGFRTSHEINKIDVLEDKDYLKLISKNGLNNFKNKSLNPSKPVTKGTSQNDDIYFQVTEARNNYYNKLPDIVENYMNKINELAGTNYKPFNYYGYKKATKVIVAMGSVCETIKETIDYLDNDIGLIEVHLYRPFSIEHLLKVLPETVRKIAVLDRTKEFGSTGEPLYLDIVSSLKDKNILIVGGRYGLSSKNTNPACIKAVYDFLDNPFNNFTVGIEDDVTNKSLKVDYDFKISNSEEMLIYGYGSDGMVSASKSIIKTVGQNTEKYVQGYFQYDSKKSGGVTICHLRFNKNKIRSTYYVEDPKLVVCTKDSYLDRFDILDKIKDNGIFILNTEKSKDEISRTLNDNIKYIIISAAKIIKTDENFYKVLGHFSLDSKLKFSSFLFFSDRLCEKLHNYSDRDSIERYFTNACHCMMNKEVKLELIIILYCFMKFNVSDTNYKPITEYLLSELNKLLDSDRNGCASLILEIMKKYSYNVLFNSGIDIESDYYHISHDEEYTTILNSLKSNRTITESQLDSLARKQDVLNNMISFLLYNLTIVYSAQINKNDTLCAINKWLSNGKNMNSENIDFILSCSFMALYHDDPLNRRDFVNIFNNVCQLYETKMFEQPSINRQSTFCKFTEEFDTIFEDGFNPTAFLFYTAPIDKSGSALQKYDELCSTLWESGNHNKILKIVHSIGQMISIYPQEGFAELKKMLKYDERIIHRGIVRVLAENIQRFPVETIDFINDSQIKLSNEDLLCVWGAQKRFVENRTFEQLHWSRLLYTLSRQNKDFIRKIIFSTQKAKTLSNFISLLCDV